VKGYQEGVRSVIASLSMIDGLIAGINQDEIKRMPPAHRQRLAQALRHVANLCDPPDPDDGRAQQEARSDRIRQFR
jgi:hypothetical protein